MTNVQYMGLACKQALRGAPFPTPPPERPRELAHRLHSKYPDISFSVVHSTFQVMLQIIVNQQDAG